jgi:ABC-type Na+ efflux pump permease subunit
VASLFGEANTLNSINFLVTLASLIAFRVLTQINRMEPLRENIATLWIPNYNTMMLLLKIQIYKFLKISKKILGVFTISMKFSEQNTKYTKRNAKD